jgi:hypothetical protein
LTIIACVMLVSSLLPFLVRSHRVQVQQVRTG